MQSGCAPTSMDHNHLSSESVATIAFMAFGLILVYGVFVAFLRWRHGPVAKSKKQSGGRSKGRSKSRRG